jgi:hypothetical protein
MTFVRVTNGCDCDVAVTVWLPNRGAAIFNSVPKNGGSKREVIRFCDYKQGSVAKEYEYRFWCPKDEQQGAGKALVTNGTGTNSAGNSASSSYGDLLQRLENARTRAEDYDARAEQYVNDARADEMEAVGELRDEAQSIEQAKELDAQRREQVRRDAEAAAAAATAIFNGVLQGLNAAGGGRPSSSTSTGSGDCGRQFVRGVCEIGR